MRYIVAYSSPRPLADEEQSGLASSALTDFLPFVPCSRFSVLGSRFFVLCSLFSYVLGSRFSVLWFSVLGSWFSVLGSRFSVLGSWFLVLAVLPRHCPLTDSSDCFTLK